MTEKKNNLKKIGLFFGSFNPIHIGHLIIANYFAEYTDLYQIWFIISPHNPLKDKQSLLQDVHRLNIVKLAIEENNKFKASDIEFKMPQPSYTINTLIYLQERYPDKEFVLMIGSDNLKNFHKWKNFELILKNYEIYVYPRYESEINHDEHYIFSNGKIKIVNAPKIEISSSYIRKAICEKKDVKYLLPEKVLKYIDEMNFYK